MCRSSSWSSWPPIAEVMKEGPSTYRPHVTAEQMSMNLKNRPAPFVVVTNLSGHLVGEARPDTLPQPERPGRKEVGFRLAGISRWHRQRRPLGVP